MFSAVNLQSLAAAATSVKEICMPRAYIVEGTSAMQHTYSRLACMLKSINSGVLHQLKLWISDTSDSRVQKVQDACVV